MARLCLDPQAPASTGQRSQPYSLGRRRAPLLEAQTMTQDPEPQPERETSYTPWPVCPHCGHENRDAWEWSLSDGYGEGDGQHDCDACDAPMFVSRQYSITYCTRPVE